MRSQPTSAKKVTTAMSRLGWRIEQEEPNSVTSAQISALLKLNTDEDSDSSSDSELGMSLPFKDTRSEDLSYGEEQKFER
jgi:hypothetical protein